MLTRAFCVLGLMSYVRHLAFARSCGVNRAREFMTSHVYVKAVLPGFECGTQRQFG
jgi:hypothetical protein